MAQVKFVGMCSGTESKVSKKGGNYSITRFVEFPSMNTFEIFGDLGLARSETPREYILEGELIGLNRAVVRAGSEPIRTGSKS